MKKIQFVSRIDFKFYFVPASVFLSQGRMFESLPIQVKICSMLKVFYFNCYSSLPIYHLLNINQYVFGYVKAGRTAVLNFNPDYKW